MSTLTVSETSVPVPALTNDPGYGPGIACWPGGDSALFTIESRGFTSRLASLDVVARRITIGGRVMGELRDAYLSMGGDDLWILCTHGLYRVDPSDLSISRRVRVPKYLAHLVPFADGTALAAAQPERIRTPVVNIPSAVLTTMTIPTPDLALDGADSSWLVSFWAGEAREFDRSMKPTRNRRSVPRGISPQRVQDSVFFVSATRKQHPGVSPEVAAPWVVEDDELCVFSIGEWRTTRSRRIPGLGAIVGIDRRGRIVAVARTASPLRRTLLIVDPQRLEVIAAHDLREPPTGMCMAGGSALAYRVRGPRINVIEWV